MTLEDLKNRCDYYKDLSTILQAKLEVEREETEALRFRNKELEQKIHNMENT